jgi:hypothetical protein
MCPTIGRLLYLHDIVLVDPWRMHEGYGSHFVTKLAATYLICKSKVRYYKVPNGVPGFHRFLYLPIVASFADTKLLDFYIQYSIILYVKPCYR